MPRYRSDLPPGARKDLRGIRDRRLHGRIIEAISALADAPRPPGCLTLVGEAEQWRVVYVIEDGRLVVTVAPRGGVRWL